MDQRLQEELRVGTLREALVMLVEEVRTLRAKAAANAIPDSPSGNALSPTCSPVSTLSSPLSMSCDEQDTETALNDRMTRARESEERAVLEKRGEALRIECDKALSEVQSLRRENEIIQKQLTASQADSTKEKSSRSVMETLIGTLRQNQDDLASQLHAISEHKQIVEDAVKGAEESSFALSRELKVQTQLVQELRSELSKGELHCRQLTQSAEDHAAEQEKERVKAVGLCEELTEANRKACAAEEQAEQRLERVKSVVAQAEAARAEATAADERATSTQTALDSVSSTLKTSVTSFEEERKSHHEEMARLLAEESEAKTSIRKLNASLEEEKSTRAGLEVERDGLSESLKTSEREKGEAERHAKKFSDDLRVLSTKHDRLLHAQRAANQQHQYAHHQQQQQQHVNPYQQKPQQYDQQPYQGGGLSGRASAGAAQHDSRSRMDNKRALTAPATKDFDNDDGLFGSFGVNGGDEFDYGVLDEDTKVGKPNSDTDGKVLTKAKSVGSSTKEDEEAPKNTKKKMKSDTCPLCSEMAYGLMALCKGCSTPFHSLCLPPTKRTLGKKFVCTDCEV